MLEQDRPEYSQEDLAETNITSGTLLSENQTQEVDGAPSGFVIGGVFMGPHVDPTPKQLANIREQLNRIKTRQS